MKIPQETFYENRRQFLFPEIDAAWQKNQQIVQIQEIKSSGRKLQLAWWSVCFSRSQCDVQHCFSNRHCNKQVDQFQGCLREGLELFKSNYSLRQFLWFLYFACSKHSRNIKTILKSNGTCDIYVDIPMFWQKLLLAKNFAIFLTFFPLFPSRKCLYNTFLRGIAHLRGR